MPAPGTHWIGDCMGPRANLGILGGKNISCACQESNPDSKVVQPVAQKLQRMRYSVYWVQHVIMLPVEDRLDGKRGDCLAPTVQTT